MLLVTAYSWLLLFLDSYTICLLPLVTACCWSLLWLSRFMIFLMLVTDGVPLDPSVSHCCVITWSIMLDWWSLGVHWSGSAFWGSIVIVGSCGIFIVHHSDVCHDACSLILHGWHLVNTLGQLPLYIHTYVVQLGFCFTFFLYTLYCVSIYVSVFTSPQSYVGNILTPK